MWTKPKIVAQFDPKMLYVPNCNLVFDEDVIARSFSAHSKAHIKGLNLCTKAACQGYQYDDSWIYMNDNFFNILEILCDQENCIHIVGQLLHNEMLFDNLYSYVLTDVIKVMKINDSIQQCVSMNIKIVDKTLRFISKSKIRTQID